MSYQLLGYWDRNSLELTASLLWKVLKLFAFRPNKKNDIYKPLQCIYITYVYLATTTPLLIYSPNVNFSCMSSGCCIQQQFLMSWCVIHDCISLLKITSTSGWSMFRRWRLPIRHFRTCQRSSLSEALSQASSHFNVDVQKLLFVLFCAHSSEDWLSRTVQNKREERSWFTASTHKDAHAVLGPGRASDQYSNTLHYLHFHLSWKMASLIFRYDKGL